MPDQYRIGQFGMFDDPDDGFGGQVEGEWPSEPRPPVTGEVDQDHRSVGLPYDRPPGRVTRPSPTVNQHEGGLVGISCDHAVGDGAERRRNRVQAPREDGRSRLIPVEFIDRFLVPGPAVGNQHRRYGGDRQRLFHTHLSGIIDHSRA